MTAIPVPSRTFSSREEMISEFREIFNVVDRDGGGTITTGELGGLLETLGVNATSEEINLLVEEIDKDHNGEIDFHGKFIFNI